MSDLTRRSMIAGGLSALVAHVGSIRSGLA